jgi:phosphoribosylaminoimidazolecarboxamide formyltransferase/IMP cyclohydrolase
MEDRKNRLTENRNVWKYHLLNRYLRAEAIMGMNVVQKIDGLVKVRRLLVSVSDKTGLDDFIPSLLKLNPDIKIFSTGGTFAHLEKILDDRARSCLTQVSDYTGQPETQGGLVKTLDFKIYLGLLTEKYNEAHQQDLARTGAEPIDMVVVNLYHFKETIAKQGVTVEQARGNIDIGGPCMIRASAKNFIRVASVVDPADYGKIIAEMKENKGCVPLGLRYRLAQKAFDHTAVYDRTIADFLATRALGDVQACYDKVEG